MNLQQKLIGLSLALVLPVIYVLFVSRIFLESGVREPTSTLIDFAVLWGLALGVLFFARNQERASWASIGWKPLSWKWALAAMGIGILLSLLVPVLTVLVQAVFPPGEAGTITQVASKYPWWILLLSVLTAGITEEILFRGYALERLLEVKGNKWISGLVSLLCFVGIHAAGWNIAHIIGVVVPLGIILTGLYWWRRNVFFVMIVHVVIDLPLVFIESFT